MKLLIGLLCIGLTIASPTPVREKRDDEFFTIIGVQQLPLEERSAPGVLQPLSLDDTVPHHEEFSSAHSLGNHEGYEPPFIHNEYGVPKIHDEYGPPPVPTLKAVPDHVCPEEDFKQEFVLAPPSPPEIVPLPEIPIVKYEPIIPEIVHEEYGVPEVPHEEYGPPVIVPPAPLCSNGAPDTSYPFCCENGAANPYCCVGEWINPTCSEPKIVEVATEKIIDAPYPAKRLCVNGAEDSTYPFCCENGATNEYCCVGQWINPTCSEPTTPAPAPLCSNGAPDSSYPFCCENGAANPFCCVGKWINPTCSEPKIVEAPYPPKVVEVATEKIIDTPYPAKRLCVNGADDSTYPYCCENGATNEYCCVGQWINPTCSEPTTPAPAPLCLNGAPDTSYPFCCENGAANPYCCVGEWINPTCSEPKIVVEEVVTEKIKEAPYPPKRLCVNGAEDSTYPFCCENGATNEYCCVGQWINPTCSEPTTPAPPPPTVKLAPYPAPVTTTTTTTTPVPFVPKSPYAGKVYSKYEDSHVKGIVEKGITRTTENIEGGAGIINVRIPEDVGLTNTEVKGEVKGRIVGGSTVRTGGHSGTATGRQVTGNHITGNRITGRVEVIGRSTGNRIVSRPQVRHSGTVIRGRTRIHGRRSNLIRHTPVKTIRFISPAHSRTVVRGRVSGKIIH